MRQLFCRDTDAIAIAKHATSFIRHNLCPLSFIDVPQQAYVDAMIGFYELNRIELLRDLFVWAYERSCQQLELAAWEDRHRHGG